MPGNNVDDAMVERGAAEMCCQAGKLGCAAQHKDSEFSVCQLHTFMDDSRRCLTAALADHVVVPREPTPEMLRAGVLADEGCVMPGNIYRAMIAAAPPVKEG